MTTQNEECLSKGYEEMDPTTHKICWALFLLYHISDVMSIRFDLDYRAIVEAAVHFKSYVNGLVCILVDCDLTDMLAQQIQKKRQGEG